MTSTLLHEPRLGHVQCLGARGLRSICESIMTDAMFEMPSDAEADALQINLSYCRSKFEKSPLRHMRAA